MFYLAFSDELFFGDSEGYESAEDATTALDEFSTDTGWVAVRPVADEDADVVVYRRLERARSIRVIEIADAEPVAGDNIADALLLTGDTGDFEWSSYGATNETGETGGPAVWVKLEAPVLAIALAIDAVGSYDPDTSISLFTGPDGATDLDDLTLLATDANTISLANDPEAPEEDVIIPGDFYFVRLGARVGFTLNGVFNWAFTIGEEPEPEGGMLVRSLASVVGSGAMVDNFSDSEAGFAVKFVYSGPDVICNGIQFRIADQPRAGATLRGGIANTIASTGDTKLGMTWKSTDAGSNDAYGDVLADSITPDPAGWVTFAFPSGLALTTGYTAEAILVNTTDSGWVGVGSGLVAEGGGTVQNEGVFLLGLNGSTPYVKSNLSTLGTDAGPPYFNRGLTSAGTTWNNQPPNAPAFRLVYADDVAPGEFFFLGAGSTLTHSNSTTQSLIPKPDAAVEGDTVIIVVTYRATPTITPTDDMELLSSFDNSGSTNQRHAIYKRIVGASEPATYEFTTGDNSAVTGKAFAMHGEVDLHATSGWHHTGSFSAGPWVTDALVTTEDSYHLVYLVGHPTGGSTVVSDPDGLTYYGYNEHDNIMAQWLDTSGGDLVPAGTVQYTLVGSGGSLWGGYVALAFIPAV